jgi:phage/plasmid-like protein (TIGR03299 family)
MAHELATTTDGRAAFFEVGAVRTAWHQLGTLLPAAPSLDEALELAGLDYPVRKLPVEIVLPDGIRTPSDLCFATVRTDRNAELGRVGPDYQVVQNRTAFRVLEPLLDQGLARLETGGVLRDGADAWLLVQWDLTRFGPIVREVFADEVLPYAIVANNHSGRRGILIGDTVVRVVCANTLHAAEERGMQKATIVRHTEGAPERLVEAAQVLWQGVIERYEVVARQYQLLKGLILTSAQFDELVLDVAVPHPAQSPRFNPEARTATSVIERAERKRAEVRRLWEAGKGHAGDHSAWEAYNGLVEAVDHDTDLFPTRGGAWRRGASLLDGTLRRMKDDVLAGLVNLGTAKD